MINKYKCERCFYQTNLYANNIKHINKKNKCEPNIKSHKYSDDQLLILSILARNINITENELKSYESTTLLYENKDYIIELFSNINCNGIKKCKYCLKEFNKMDTLKKHILIDCYKNNHSNKISNIIINDNSITDNSTTNITNNNNNIYINIELKCPIPFNNNNINYDMNLNNTNNINFDTFNDIFIKKYFTKTYLSEILNNDNNLNVILNNNDKKDLVYNDLEYVKTMDKIKNHIDKIINDDKESEILLNNIFNDIQDSLKKEIIDIKQYKSEVKNLIINIINQIYTLKSNDSVKTSNHNNLSTIFGY